MARPSTAGRAMIHGGAPASPGPEPGATLGAGGQGRTPEHLTPLGWQGWALFAAALVLICVSIAARLFC